MGDVSMNTNEMNKKNQVWKMENVGEGKMKLSFTLDDKPVDYEPCGDIPKRWDYGNFWRVAL